MVIALHCSLLQQRAKNSNSQMEHYFFSYLLTCEVYLIKVLEISAQMLQYITFLSLKAIKVSSDFILNYLKKVVGGATAQKYQKQILKPWYILYGSAPRGPWGVKRCAPNMWVRTMHNIYIYACTKIEFLLRIKSKLHDLIQITLHTHHLQIRQHL